MSLELNTNQAAYRQLADIASVARSSSLKTAGNIGLIDGRVVKFNTHWSERAFGTVTQEMLDASNAMRATLKSLVGAVMAGSRAETERLFAMIDGKGAQSLLDRKVVVDVIAKAQSATGLNMTPGAGDVAALSSKGVKTDFDSVKLATGRERCYRQVMDRSEALSRELSAEMWGGAKSVDFLVYAQAFAKAYAAANIVPGAENRPLEMSYVDHGLGLMARLALGGRTLPVRGDITKTLVNGCNGTAADCFVKLARGHEIFGASLLALCDETNANLLMRDADRLDTPANQPKLRSLLTREGLFGHLAGTKMSDELEGGTYRAFNRELGKAWMRQMRVRAGMPASGPATPTQLMSALQGAAGIMLSDEMSLKVQNVPAEGVHVTFADVQASASGYDVSMALDKGDAGLRKGLTIDIPRNRPVYTIGDKVFDCRDLKDPAAIKKAVDDIVAALEAFCTTKEQRLVAGLMLTQGGQVMAVTLPVGADADHASMSFTLAKDDAGAVTLRTVNNPVHEGAPSLSFAYTLQPDGTNALSDLDYRAQPQA